MGIDIESRVWIQRFLKVESHWLNNDFLVDEPAYI